MYKKEGARGSHFPLLPIPHYITTSTLIGASMGLLMLGTIHGLNGLLLITESLISLTNCIVSLSLSKGIPPP